MLLNQIKHSLLLTYLETEGTWSFVLIFEQNIHIVNSNSLTLLLEHTTLAESSLFFVVSFYD